MRILASAAANLDESSRFLVQAGVAALAQANSAPQQILSLLRGLTPRVPLGGIPFLPLTFERMIA